MRKILVTGFEPFDKSSLNPSKSIVRELEQDSSLVNLETLILPVDFKSAAKLLIEKVDSAKPDVVICLGQAEGRSAITPERVAINIDDARIPDNAGNFPKNTEIISGGADGLFSTLPVYEIVEKLSRSDIPSSISYSAGTYVCNNVFYLIQSHCKDKNIKSGFVHIPLMESQASEFPGLPTLSFETMLNAIKIIIAEVQRQ